MLTTNVRAFLFQLLHLNDPRAEASALEGCNGTTDKMGRSSRFHKSVFFEAADLSFAFLGPDDLRGPSPGHNPHRGVATCDGSNMGTALPNLKRLETENSVKPHCVDILVFLHTDADRHLYRSILIFLFLSAENDSDCPPAAAAGPTCAHCCVSTLSEANCRSGERKGFGNGTKATDMTPECRTATSSAKAMIIVCLKGTVKQ